jgi:arylsulfatase A-like enzyme
MVDAIGRVVAALERTGQRRKTLIVFTSDNGGPRQSEDARHEENASCANGVSSFFKEK